MQNLSAAGLKVVNRCLTDVLWIKPYLVNIERTGAKLSGCTVEHSHHAFCVLSNICMEVTFKGFFPQKSALTPLKISYVWILTLLNTLRHQNNWCTRNTTSELNTFQNSLFMVVFLLRPKTFHVRSNAFFSLYCATLFRFKFICIKQISQKSVKKKKNQCLLCCPVSWTSGSESQYN